MELDKPSKDVDFFRDTPARYLGYFNEVGESFRPLIHVNWVRLSYVVSSAYVLADTADKSIKMKQNTPGNDSYCWRKVIVAGVDTLIWQSFASVIIPGITINRLCAGSLYVLKKTTKLPKTPRKWITTAIGLVSIPFIIKPIDRLVDYAMDDTFRKYVVVKPKPESEKTPDA